MKKFFHWCIFFACTTVASNTFSKDTEPILTISESKDFFPLNRVSSMLMDKDGRLSLNDILEKRSAFLPIKDEIFNLEKVPEIKAFWIHSVIENATGKELEYVFYLHQGLDSVDYFIFFPDGKKQHVISSSTHKTRNSPYFISQELVTPIILQPGTTQIYLRIANKSSWSQQMGSIIFSAAEKQRFINYFLEFRFYQGIALGMLFLILIFHFFLYLFFRDATYLAFLVNILFTLFYLLLRKNFQLEFDGLSSLLPFIEYLQDPACVFISATAIWFSQLFLGTKQDDPILNKIMTLLIFLQIAVAVITLSLQQLLLLNALTIYLGFLSGIIVIVASIRSFLRGNKLALYVFFGFILLAGVPLVYLIPMPNYLHYRTSESDIHYFGEAFRSIIFAVGITDRFYQLKKEIARKEIEKKQLQFEQEKRLQEERERISRDLHDNIGSQLALLSMELGLLSKHHVDNSEIESINENTKVIIGQLRDTVWVLENDQVTVSNIEYKLATFLLPNQKNTHIKFALEISESAKNLALKPTQAINVFRIIQEALQNGIKHGRCSLIKTNIGIDATNKNFLVQVADDGCGFDVDQDAIEGHYGLRNMKRRAKEINGCLEIISAKQKGTIVSLSFPL